MKSTELYFEKVLRFLRGEIFTAKACLPDRQAQRRKVALRETKILPVTFLSVYFLVSFMKINLAIPYSGTQVCRRLGVKTLLKRQTP